MFILDGKRLPLDKAFTTADGRQFPANWLRLSTLEEKQAIGITEEPDEVTPVYDQRFYWGPNLPKDHAQLVEQWVGQIKQTAGSLLSQTDWYITRQAETGKQTPPEVLLQRLGIRDYSNTKEDAIRATNSTDELAAYVTSSAFNGWPEKDTPQQPDDALANDSSEAPVVVSDTDVIDFSTSGTAITGSGLYGGSGEDILTFN